MLDIIKTKGIAFFIKRLSDKVIEKGHVLISEKRDLNNSTYCDIYLKNEDVTNIYDSNQINYSIPDKDKILNFAKMILEHKFNLLGSGLQNVTYNNDYKGLEGNKYNFKLEFNDISDLVIKSIGEQNYKISNDIAKNINSDYKPIDWQRDFLSGYRWDSKTYYKNIRFGNLEGIDIKVPWELGRLSHLLIIFYSWKFTDDDIYFHEFKNQIYDFMAFNPPRFGVQWTTSMDVALRAVNLVSVYSLFFSSGVFFEDRFKVLFYNYLYSHLLHIINNLEWSSGMRANHYYANICGLIYLSSFLPTDTTTSFIFNFALNELLLETDYQFNSDGSNFEASIPYHHFTSEMLFKTYLMLTNLESGKINELVRNFNKSNSSSFNLHSDLKIRINNNHKQIEIENGKIKFPNDFVSQMKEIADFTINLLSPKYSDYKIGDNDDGYFFRFIPLISEDYSIQTDNRTELYKIATYINPDTVRKPFEFYDKFGIYIFRNTNYEICVRCGSLGQNGKGGHSHNDQLSFELYSGNELLICDSGTFNYTALPKLRNKFRSTKSHNTLIIDDLEQNPINDVSSGGLFWLQDNSKAKMIGFDHKSFTGEHYGFPVPHRRSFSLFDSEIAGKDICNIKGKKIILFRLTHQAKIIELRDNSVKINCNNTIFSITASNGKIKSEASEYSPSYNVKYSTEMIVIESEENEIFWNIIL